MDRKQFIDALFARAKEAGFDACEVFYSTSSDFDTDIFKGEILKYSAADSLGLGFRGLYNGRMGYASTQILDAAAIDLLVDGAKTNAELIENDDKQFIHDGKGDYAAVVTFNPAIEEITAAEKIRMARKLEELTLTQDPRIEQVEGCCILSANAEVEIVNNLGLHVSQKANYIGGYVAPIARDGEKVNSGISFFFTMNPDEIDLEKVAAEAAKSALDGLDATSVESGDTRVLFSPDAATDMLHTFSGIFSADAAQKGLSLLKGREGEAIAAECVTIVDNPHMPGSVVSGAFDGEGVATKVKNVIENGALTTLLHNLKTAHKQGVASTGNAARSYASTVGVSPSNFYFAPTEATEDEMLARLGDGLLITDVQGLHAGANPISGDFSLSAKGWKIENGKRVHTVKQITVAGNFYQLLKDIEAVGGDLKFGLPSGSRFGSPSLLVRSLAVAGK